MISCAIINGRCGVSINYANGKICDVYLYPGTHNQYVVVARNSRNLVQLSNFIDNNWKPDKGIR